MTTARRQSSHRADAMHAGRQAPHAPRQDESGRSGESDEPKEFVASGPCDAPSSRSPEESRRVAWQSGILRDRTWQEVSGFGFRVRVKYFRGVLNSKLATRNSV